MSIWSGSVVLITGGTGSFARVFMRHLLATEDPVAIRLFSRSELRRAEMQRDFSDPRLRFLSGDVADYDRVLEAMDGVNIVIHAAALKRVEGSEQDTAEAIKTNVIGSMNIVRAAIERKVERAMGLSSDKGCAPVLAYGATKLLMEKLFLAPRGASRTMRACVRYGNVAASAGSIVPILIAKRDDPVIELRDKRTTRFWTTLGDIVRWTKRRIELIEPASVYVPILPSIRLCDLASAIAPNARIEWTGHTSIEKVHEQLVAWDESRYALRCSDPDTFDYYRIGTTPTRGKEFVYSSDENPWRMDVSEIRAALPRALREAGYPEQGMRAV